MFYEIKEKEIIINLDQIITIDKYIDFERKKFILAISFCDNSTIDMISFDSLIKLDLEYKLIKNRLIEIYG
ncbi:MAG: hypothetical protein PHF21_05350 [Bacilli bacterium]|nr:hypothetical protein [Bacilli bacterium]